jgi:hypothetical protein
MLKKIPFYLFLFAIVYFLTKDVPLGDFFWILLIFLITEVLIFAGLYVLTKEIIRSAYLTFLILSWILYFGTVSQIGGNFLNIKITPILYLVFLIPWTLIFILLASRTIWQRPGNAQNITIFLNIILVATFFFFGYQVVKAETLDLITPLNLSTRISDQTVKVGYKPDIYYIILDAYPRNDELKKMFGYDNSEFTNFLSSRGFYIASQSQANYIYTEVSISSALNMSYLNSISTGEF